MDGASARRLPERCEVVPTLRRPAQTKPQGRIFADGRRLVIDADPHVMAKVRGLFESGVRYHSQGRHTHKPVAVNFTLAGCRDIVWLMERFSFEVDAGLLYDIHAKSNEYDRIVASVETADQDSTWRSSERALELALPLRDYQVQFVNFLRAVGGRTLLADKMGLGKTPSGIALFVEPEARPGLVVVPTHLCAQWERQFQKFLPGAKVHVIKGHKHYPLPPADIYVTSYNRIVPWQDVLIRESFPLRTVVMDEVHELRHTDTAKRGVARVLAERAETSVGLSGTPIYNYGSEIWSVLDAIAPGRLGREDDFLAEWCFDKKVLEPTTLHSFLKTQGLMLRREQKDVGIDFGEVSKHVYTLDSDLEQLKKVQDVARMLAISVCSGVIGSSDKAERDFDWKLRHATGVAKARPVAEFVKLCVEESGKVLLAGWHHDVYDIWMKELVHLNPVKFTGSETPAEKDAAFKKFTEDDTCKVMIISLRSGAGIDGLQYACNTIVVGELDWSPHVMDQLQFRLNRPGQERHVQMFFLTVADGADPFMTQVLNLKRSQHDGLIEGLEAEAAILEGPSFDKGRVREMAAAYLRSIGEEVPEPVLEAGLLGDVAAALRRVRVPTSTEAELQEALSAVLGGLLGPETALAREVRFSKRSRIDFLATRGDEKVGIECKVTSRDRAEVYRQVRRYAQELGCTSIVLFAPWSGIPSFVVDAVPVVVVDFSQRSL